MQEDRPYRTAGFQLARLMLLASIFAVGGFLWISCNRELDVVIRLASALCAVLCFLLPARVFFVGMRRYLRTGNWVISPEERSAWRQRCAVRRPYQRWVEPAVTGLLLALAFLNLGSLLLHRHGLPIDVWDGVCIAFWLTFATRKGRTLWKELHPRGPQAS